RLRRDGGEHPDPARAGRDGRPVCRSGRDRFAGAGEPSECRTWNRIWRPAPAVWYPDWRQDPGEFAMSTRTNARRHTAEVVVAVPVAPVARGTAEDERF